MKRRNRNFPKLAKLRQIELRKIELRKNGCKKEREDLNISLNVRG